MTRDLNQLYQAMILEHNKNPRHFGKIEDADHICHGVNPLCGDDYWVYLKITGDVVSAISFFGAGCAISKASGSMMADAIKGKPIAYVKQLLSAFLSMSTSDAPVEEEVLGKMRVFQGVKQFPVRVKCATLVWRALEAAISENANAVSTE